MTATRASQHNQPTRSLASSATANRVDRVRTKSIVDFDEENNSASIAPSHDTFSGVQLETQQNTPIPQWQRELASSQAGRQSRASSIISTRTRLTVQSDDARSVEIQAGGHSFRISRDGSRVTDVSAPPPYPGPPLDQLAEESDEEALSVRSPSNDDEGEPEEVLQATTPQVVPTTFSLPLRIHMPPGAIQYDTPPEGNHRVGAGASQVLVFPQKLKNMFGLNWSGSAGCTAALAENSAAAQLRRTQSDSSSLLQSEDTLSSSTINLLRTIRGHQASHSLPDPLIDPGDLRQDVSNIPLSDDGDKKAAEVSKCYNQVMRDLDREHRKKLHERDSEIAQLRALLNEKDIVYRQQLRDRDNTIQMLTEQVSYKNITMNEVKTQIYELEEDMERRLEQARNVVEDMWERRWKDYERLLLAGFEKKNNATGVSLSQDYDMNSNDTD